MAVFGQLPVVVLYAIFVGFHNTYAGDFGPFVTFHGGAPGVSETMESRWTSVVHCPAPPQASPPSAPIKIDG